MIGLCSVTFRDQSVEEVIALAKQAELQVIEWGSDVHVPETDIENAENVARLMKDAGLKSASYGTYYKLGSFESFDAYIKAAKILGASTIRVWAGVKGSAETDTDTRKQIIEDAGRIGELAANAGIQIGIEYHSKTLTDTPSSALKLMQEINSPHVLLYWQPAENLSVEERIDSLQELAPYITNVHVFHWEHYNKRFPLADAADDWKRYIHIIQKQSPHKNNFLLEFAPGEDPVQGFLENAETLRKLV